MNIDNVPQAVWKLLAQEAQRAGQTNAFHAVDDYFYDQIYRKWAKDFQKIDYEYNLPGKVDVGWGTVAEVWKNVQGQPGKLKDHSWGTPAMQTEDNDPTHAQSRLGERYSDSPSVSRFQFLVSAGGGMVLLNRMRRACQTYIHDKKATVVQWWKVFGESFAQQGQSDACVVYLLLHYSDPHVVEFVDNYLWPNVKDIINDKFVPVGLVQVAQKPLWATWIPSKAKWSAEFGAPTLQTHYGSAGGLMGLVFGKAFQAAMAAKPKNEDALITAAKQQAKAIVQRLA